jgi:hypothetical protein
LFFGLFSFSFGGRFLDGRFSGGCRVFDHCEFAELLVTDHLITVVVDTAENSFNVFAAGVKSIGLQVFDEFGDTDRVETTGDVVECTNLNKVRARGKLAVTLITVTLKGHLLFKETHNHVDAV